MIAETLRSRPKGAVYVYGYLSGISAYPVVTKEVFREDEKMAPEFQVINFYVKSL